MPRECGFLSRTVAPNVAGIREASDVCVGLVRHRESDFASGQFRDFYSESVVQTAVAFCQTLCHRLGVPAHSVSDEGVGIHVVEVEDFCRADFRYSLGWQYRLGPCILIAV